MENALYTVAAAVVTATVAMIWAPRKKNGASAEFRMLARDTQKDIRDLNNNVQRALTSNHDLIKESVKLRVKSYDLQNTIASALTLLTQQNSQVIELNKQSVVVLSQIDRWQVKMEERLSA